MLIKAGVDISRLNREIRRSLPRVQDLLDLLDNELTVTSTYEGNHGEGSLHYCNDAYDIKKPTEWAPGLKEELQIKLGKSFDVVLESDHLHIEYDPK